MKDSEKLILLMLSEIYENLEIDSSEVNPGFIKSAIFTDNTWGITWEYSMILSEETPVEVKDVVDILSTVVNSVDDILKPHVNFSSNK